MRKGITELSQSVGGQRHKSYASGISLLFENGQRPSILDIERLLSDQGPSAMPLRISHKSAAAEGWVELLSNGLTFDLGGLLPAEPKAWPEPQHLFGFERPPVCASLEALHLVQGPHLGSGMAMPPVVRTMAGIAANLSNALPVKGLLWQPAMTLMEPKYFSGMILNWLNGGAFPALGLTALSVAGDGSVSSAGLDYFIGQDVQVQARPDEKQADTVKLAVRVIDYLVRNGPISEPLEIRASSEVVIAEPSKYGNAIRVWRSD